METAKISDPYRIPITAQRIADGRIMLHTPGRPVQFFSKAEIQRLHDFSLGLGKLVTTV